MTNDDDERGRVIEAFLEGCNDPSVEDVKRWCRAHPLHRDAIIQAAAELMEIALLARRGWEKEGGLPVAPQTRDAMKHPKRKINRLRDRGSDEEAC